MASAEAIANAKKILADPNASEARKKVARQMIQLGDTGGGTTATPPDARKLMEHYQRQIAGDDDYAEEKNPGARNPKYSPYPAGDRTSMRRPAEPELESMNRRFDRPGDKPGQGTKRTFSDPYPVGKQRSTKKNPVPRGTVGNKTMEELDLLMQMMGGDEPMMPSR